jgi:hypothetical protein
MTTQTITIEPSPVGYIHMLKLIADASTVAADRVWAKGELAAIAAGKGA